MRKRNVFISCLGFSKYNEVIYTRDKFSSEPVRYIQEATLDYLQSNGVNLDIAYIMLTDGAYHKNWLDDGHRDRETKEIIRQPGLKTCLERKNYPFEIKPIKDIPDGNDESQIMTIFKCVFDLIQPGDCLYIDITHGFRSLPMLMLVLGNYAKFLKDVTINSITYGNWEARDQSVTPNVAQIIDLLSLSQLQDWTSAAASYLHGGNATQIVELVKQQPDQENSTQLINIADLIDQVSKEINTCRGLQFYQADTIQSLKQAISSVGSSSLLPLNPVLEKIQENFKDFTTEGNELNGIAAVKWCIKNGLYQQAYTILQETVISFFVRRYGLKIDSKSQRELVNTAHFILSRKTEEQDWRCKPEEKPIIAKLINDPDFQNCKKAFGKLTDFRNDYNHSGMRSNASSYTTIITELNQLLTWFQTNLFTEENLNQTQNDDTNQEETH